MAEKSNFSETAEDKLFIEECHKSIRRDWAKIKLDLVKLETAFEKDSNSKVHKVTL